MFAVGFPQTVIGLRLRHYFGR